MMRLISLLAFMALVSVPEAMACPVCYGDKDSALTAGMNWAILFLLGVTGTVLGGISSFFLYMKKRSKITLNGSVDPPSLN